MSGWNVCEDELMNESDVHVNQPCETSEVRRCHLSGPLIGVTLWMSIISLNFLFQDSSSAQPTWRGWLLASLFQLPFSCGFCGGGKVVKVHHFTHIYCVCCGLNHLKFLKVGRKDWILLDHMIKYKWHRWERSSSRLDQNSSACP